MADNESDRSPISSENSESNDKQSKQESETGMSDTVSKSDNKEEDNANRDGCTSKDEEADSRGAYTAGTRGFPPSRFTSRGPVFGGSSHFGGNPFAVKSSNLSKAEGGHEGGSQWPGLTPSKLGGSTVSTSSPSRPVLRPPQLSSPAAGQAGSPLTTRQESVAPTRSSFPLNPSRLGNPFCKAPQTDGGDEGTDKSEQASAAEDSTAATASPAISAATSQSSSTSSSSTPLKFMPLGTPSNSNNSQDSSTSLTSTPTSFVFGQNLHERVVESSPNHFSQNPSTSKQTENGTAEPSSSTPTTNGTSSGEMLFSAGLKKEQPQESNSDSGGDTPAKSLSEAAREYEESRAVKRKYEAVTVMTGEEDETNVLQITCKLYAYDKSAGSWSERGRGQLRLNDKVDKGAGSTAGGALQSRVIMRTSGSLRVILNTKVWPGMVVDRANSKSVRLTAMDNDQIKVFLVQATMKEAESLHTALERRVASQRLPSNCDRSPNSPHSPQPGREAAVEEARSGLEASSFPEPSSKKGRSSLGSNQDSDPEDDQDEQL